VDTEKVEVVKAQKNKKKTFKQWQEIKIQEE